MLIGLVLLNNIGENVEIVLLAGDQGAFRTHRKGIKDRNRGVIIARGEQGQRKR